MQPTASQTTNHQSPTTLKGWVSTSYQTYKGKRLGPYHIRHWKVNGKLKSQYVKPSELENVKAACQANRDKRQRGNQIAKDFYNTIGNLNWLRRMASRRDKGELRPEDYAFIEALQKHGFTTPGRPPLRTTKVFMYPRTTNYTDRLWKSLKKEAYRAFKSRFAHETIDEKWTRWRKELANRPPPRPLPRPHIADAALSEKVDRMAEQLCARMDQVIN